jgi:Leucine-rich repeat (LRR) protein
VELSLSLLQAPSRITHTISSPPSLLGLSVGSLGLLTPSTYLANNEIAGPVPHAKCHHGDNLRILDFSNNNFCGTLPTYLFNCKSLAVLRLRENNLTGAWPDSIKKGCTLRLIDMHGNQITGRMPRPLTNCQGLEFLDVSKNSIVDSFPFWLGELHDLFVLVLRTNLLHGTLLNLKEKENLTINHFQNLQIIDLAQNNFDGALPENLFKNSRPMTNPTIIGESTLAVGIPRTESVYQVMVEIAMKEVYINVPKVLLDLVVIDLSENRFSGLIPEKYGNLTALHVLNMSHNALTGEIPHELSHLTRLESLDLSWNMLYGEIPPELAISLTSLEWLNLSYNNLSGRIPSGPQFSTFPSSTFQGNKRLYGCPLPVDRSTAIEGSSNDIGASFLGVQIQE